MTESGRLELELNSDPGVLPDAREAMGQWCRRHAWTDDLISEIVLALDEALTNVIRHGYGGSAGQRIIVKAATICDLQAGEGVEISIRDFGKQVALESICGRDLDRPRPGGLGVHIIRAMMDVAEYSHAEGGGIRLIMRKYKSSKRAAHDPDAGAT